MHTIDFSANEYVIYGAGMVGNLVRQYFEVNGEASKILSFAVSEKNKSYLYNGYRCCSIDDLSEYADAAVVIVATFPGPQDAIERKLIELGFENIIKLNREIYQLMANAYIENFLVNVKLRPSYDIMYMASDNNKTSGAFLCLVDLAKDMNKRGLSVLVVLPEYGDGEGLLAEKEIDYTYVPSKTWLKRIDGKELTWQEQNCPDNEKAELTLENMIKNLKIKLVHCNTTYAHIGAIAAYKLKVPVVWHIREIVFEQGYGYVDELDFFNEINSSNKIILVSKYIQKCYARFDQSKTQVIYDGVDIDSYYNEKDVFYGYTLNILMPGALYPLKRQSDLVQAARILADNNIDFNIRFVGAGDQDYIVRLNQMAEEYNLTDCIHFMGRVDNLFELYKTSDLVISCSGVESFGRVCVEGMLAGCLVIGADRGGTTELISHGIDGLLFHYKDYEDLARLIIDSVLNADKSRKIARNGQKYAVEHFSKELCSKRIYELYTDLKII